MDERNHMRLWLAPIHYRGDDVYVGQISRDIGVKFSPKTLVIVRRALRSYARCCWAAGQRENGQPSVPVRGGLSTANWRVQLRVRAISRGVPIQS